MTLAFINAKYDRYRSQQQTMTKGVNNPWLGPESAIKYMGGREREHTPTEIGTQYKPRR